MRAVTHLPIKLVFACLLAVAMLATIAPLPLRAQETAGLAVHISPSPQRSGDTAVRYSDSDEGRLAISGTAPDASTITAATLVALDAGGAQVGEQNLAGVGILNNSPDNGDYLRNDKGTITGAITLSCVFGGPQQGCPSQGSNPVRDIRLDLTVGSASGSSNAFRVDFERPIIRSYETVAPDRIKVIFSEPMRTNATPLTEPNQWSVEASNGVARTVTAVGSGSVNDCAYGPGEDARAGASGCTRILTIAGPALSEDEIPQVSLMTGPLAPVTESYEDFATNQVLLSTDLNADNKATSKALDRIRPAKPNIETVAGKTPSSGEVVSTVTKPTVVLTNLTSGHTVALSFTANGTTTTMDAVEVPAGANSVELTPSLPADGTYVLSAVATDGAGNSSNESAKNAARDDKRSSVNYVLDTIAPKIDSAHFVNRRTVDVTFSEVVTPANDAGQWMIGDDPAEASGEGATRQLTAQVDTTSGAGVTWSPTNGSTYTDRAENTLVAVKGFPLSDLPAVPAPTVTIPERELATTASKVTIAGTAPSNNQYLVAQLFERNGETPLMQVPVADGSWQFEHTVPAEQRTQLQVRLRDTKTFVTSPRVDVADIVHDTTAPVVDVLLPAAPALLGDPEQLGVGDSVTITWTATDQANDAKDPDHSRAADIFVVADGVEKLIAEGILAKPGTEQSFTYTLSSSDLGDKRVRDLSFRVDVSDDAGNTGDDASGTIRLLVSTTVADPTVTAPAQQVFTAGSTVTISGTSPADNETNEYLDAQLFERGGDTPVATTSTAGGTWTFDYTPNADQRNELQVRLRDRDTGITSRLVSVPDIVHDATAPVVDVRLPASADLLGRPQEFGVGDVVTITWVATDKANDVKQPDHSKTASVFKVAGSSSTAIKTGIVAQPGQEQTVTYTLTESDLAGQGLRDLTFRVDVTDQANNIGGDVSATIRLLGDRVGYTPVLTAPDTIEVRFAEQLQGVPGPSDWTVDGQPVLLAEAPVDRNGTTVVVLHTPLATDPNATPAVQFTPTLPATQRLRSMNDSQITLAARTTIDRTLPALTVKRPDTPDVIDADRIRFTGTTDVTKRPNTIVAYYADAAGNRRGSPVASRVAGADGAWQLRVPLVANRLNRIVFRAVDPSNNRSAVAPDPHFSVVEDSTHPVVTALTPRSGATVGPTTRIRWSTVEAHPRFARIQYRVRSASNWKTVASKTRDDGFYRWATPRKLHGRVFLLRVTAVDRTGKSDSLTRTGLRADLVRPELRRARSIAPNKVRLYFSEAVKGARAGAFEVDGRAVRRVKRQGEGKVRTLVLRSALKRTTPLVEYRPNAITDAAGNTVRGREERAVRGFAFPVRAFDADRTSARSVKLNWRDGRNRAQHVRGYRIYRDGRAIALVGRWRRSFRDRSTGSHTYAVRTLDDQGRRSFARKDRVR